MKPSDRQYTGVTQYFHNYEHDPEGLTHCRGPATNPYRIVHYNGGHIINVEYAKGHGKRNIPQWFRFTRKSGAGWDLTSGVEIEPTNIPANGKTKIYFKINDDPILKSKVAHDIVRDKLKNLLPIKTKKGIGKIFKKHD